MLKRTIHGTLFPLPVQEEYNLVCKFSVLKHAGHQKYVNKGFNFLKEAAELEITVSALEQFQMGFQLITECYHKLLLALPCQCIVGTVYQ